MKKNSPHPITIVGAGIGGLTTALALKRKDIHVEVYEGAPEIKPVGAGIVMANNAMQIFDRLGVRKAVEAAGCRISTIRITDEHLRTLSSSDLGKFEGRYGVYNVAIHRADLQQILAEAVGYDHIHLAKRLLMVEEKTGFTLRFDDKSCIETDILIGADGIKSRIREYLFKRGKIRDTMQRCWRGVAEIDWTSRYENEAYEAWGRGKRFGFVRISDRKIYWFAVLNAHLLEQGKDPGAYFTEFHADIQQIMADTPESDIIYNDLIDLEPMNHWSRGAACLIGDAAHATTPNMGQGACQAVEDAYILGELFGTGLPVEEVFARYEQLRRGKAHFIVNSSWRLGKVAQWENTFGCWLRNTLMKSLPDSLNEKQMERVFDISYLRA